MNPDEIKQLIETGIADCEARVTGDGSHFEAIVISEEFAGMSTLKKQQRVFATLGDRVTSGAIHALSIRAYTREEWAQSQTG